MFNKPRSLGYTYHNDVTLSTDYVRTGLSSLTFTESGTQTIPVAIVDDMVFENTESFSIVLSNPQPGSVVLNPDTITITITDNDGGCKYAIY